MPMTATTDDLGWIQHNARTNVLLMVLPNPKRVRLNEENVSKFKLMEHVFSTRAKHKEKLHQIFHNGNDAESFRRFQTAHTTTAFWCIARRAIFLLFFKFQIVLLLLVVNMGEKLIARKSSPLTRYGRQVRFVSITYKIINEKPNDTRMTHKYTF